MNKYAFTLLIASLFITVYLFVFGFHGPVNAQIQPVCKVGVANAAGGAADFNKLKSYGVCQMYDWGAYPETAQRANAAGIEYLPMLKKCRDGSVPINTDTVNSLKSFAQQYPGSRWLLFNEPDVSNQANCFAENPVNFPLALESYKRAVEAIQSVDPNAKFGCCGEGWAHHDWLDAFYNEYLSRFGQPPQIDFLHMHLYDQNFIYDSTYDERMRTAFNNWDSWRATTSWSRNLSVLVTEFGPLSSDESLIVRTVNEYIPNLVPFLLAKSSVKGSFWFSTYFYPSGSPDPEWWVSNLCTDSSCNTLTSVGSKYFSYRTPISATPTLSPTPTTYRTPTPTPITGTKPFCYLYNQSPSSLTVVPDTITSPSQSLTIQATVKDDSNLSRGAFSCMGCLNGDCTTTSHWPEFYSQTLSGTSAIITRTGSLPLACQQMVQSARGLTSIAAAAYDTSGQASVGTGYNYNCHFEVHLAGISPTPTQSITPTSTPPVIQVISSLSVYDTDNASNWSIKTDLKVNNLQYGDRTYTFSTIPGVLTGAHWIRTANDSKKFTNFPLAKFIVNYNSTVYIAHNDYIDPRPSWLNTWTDTGLDLVNSESTPRYFSVFSKTYPAGSTISLGSNGDTNASMYTVIIKAQIPTPTSVIPTVHPCAASVPGDIDCNGMVNLIDLSRVLSKFGQPGNFVEDVDGNGIVNLVDLSKLLSNFGKSS
jgi:hypothetical protein